MSLSNTQEQGLSPTQWARINAERDCIMSGSFRGLGPRDKLLLLHVHQHTLAVWEPFLLRDDAELASYIGESNEALVTRAISTLVRHGWLVLTEAAVPGAEPLSFLSRGPAMLEEFAFLLDDPQ